MRDHLSAGSLPSGCNNQVWASPKSGTRNSILISHMGGMGHLLLPSQTRYQEIGLEVGQLRLKPAPWHGMPGCKQCLNWLHHNVGPWHCQFKKEKYGCAKVKRWCSYRSSLQSENYFLNLLRSCLFFFFVNKKGMKAQRRNLKSNCNYSCNQSLCMCHCRNLLSTTEFMPL